MSNPAVFHAADEGMEQAADQERQVAVCVQAYRCPWPPAAEARDSGECTATWCVKMTPTLPTPQLSSGAISEPNTEICGLASGQGNHHA